MAASEYNAYRNAAFGNGRYGTIQLRAGGNMEIAAKDTVDINENGLLIHHNDDQDTLTLVPWGNVGYVRTLSPKRVPVKELPRAESDGWSQEIGDGGNDAPRELPE